MISVVMVATLSKSSLRRACSRLRAGSTRENDLDLLSAYRDEHLSLVGSTIPALVDRTEGIRTVVTGRLKRMDAIVRKIIRQHTSITSMDDLVGVRFIVGTRKEQQSICERLRGYPGWVQTRNYIFDSKMDGYRAAHEIMEATNGGDGGGKKLRLEVQVRTSLQDLWANLSEALGQQVKEGGGDEKLRRALLHLSGEIRAYEEREVVGDKGEHLDSVGGRLRSYYVLLFDGQRRRLDDIIDYNGFVEDALGALRALERGGSGGGNRDIILLYSSNVGMVEFTHSRYFPGTLLRRLSSAIGMHVPDYVVKEVLSVS